MELLYLLGSILSASITSLLLSLLIPVHLLLRRFFPRRSAAVDGEEEHDDVSLYEGTVWHERRRPVHHSFRYSVRYAFVDLDRCTRPPPDHLSADECRSIAQTRGSVFLLTVPPSVGYDQNPLSVYYCYDVEGSAMNLKICIAEVTNTPWGERVLFLFNPNSDVVAKPLHVSPFMDMLGNWTIKANAPGENMFIIISVQHPELGDYFTAALTAKRISSSTVDHALFFWLMPHKVAIWIYWHALKLWWKGVPFIQHPRYTNEAYRQEALIRDGSCPAFSGINSNRGVDKEEENGKNRRCFTWRDAKWPWS